MDIAGYLARVIRLLNVVCLFVQNGKSGLAHYFEYLKQKGKFLKPLSGEWIESIFLQQE